MGPLSGLRVIAIGGIGPAPFCAMLLADMGADVVRIDRVESHDGPIGVDARTEVLHRNQRSVAIDLKAGPGVATVLRMCASADALIEGYRPGVMERLGLSPERCFEANPRLVYGRMTGWGQTGPLAGRPGHDINYVALSGVLSLLGRDGEPPLPPLNLIGDMGGGGLLHAFGIVCAIIDAQRTGSGQVVDTSMVEGSALLASVIFALRAAGWWRDTRGSNLLDGGAPFYNVYATSDGGYMAVGALEPKFYAELLDGLGLADDALPAQMDTGTWPGLKQRFAAIFRTRTRDEWTSEFENRDACVVPVLTLAEAAAHPHNKARKSFCAPDDVLQAAPAPRFSRSEPSLPTPPPQRGGNTSDVLADYGFSTEEISTLKREGIIR